MDNTDISQSISGISIEEFRADMEELKKSNKDQAVYAKRQYIQTLISTVAVLIVCISIIISGFLILPKVNTLLDSAITSLNNVNSITREISKIDFEGLIDDVGSLVTTTEDDLALTMEKLNSIDFEGLNEGIENLSAVIEPLADFFGALSGGRKR